MKVQRDELVQALALVRPGLANKEIVENSTAIMFGGGRAITYNDEIYASAPLPEGVELEGAVNGDKLYAILKQCKDSTITLKQNKRELVVQGKAFRSGLKRTVLDTLPDVGEPKKWVKLTEPVLEGVRLCLFSVTHDATRPLLTCVHIFPQGVESCDNFRVSRFSTKTGAKKSLLVPGRHAQHLLNYDGINAYGETEGWLHFRSSDGVVFCCRTYSEEYPDLTPLLEEQGEPVRIPSRVQEMMEAAGVFVDAEHKVDAEITMHVADAIKLRTEGAMGWYEGKCKVKYGGEPCQIAINPFMLSDILKMKGKLYIGENTLQFRAGDFLHQAQMQYVEEAE